MRYKLLGRSGLRVSELALGTMTFGEDWGWRASRLDIFHNVAQEIGKPMAHVAMNRVRQQQQQAQIIPILGARTTSQLEDGLAILDWQLESEHLARLDQVSAIELGFPHGFLDGNRYVFGNTFDRIDNHHRWGQR
jgi:aryl-alcohol dehydrogenase-like predicted oxidoreductase